MLDYLRTVCPDIYLTQGDFDDLNNADHTVRPASVVPHASQGDLEPDHRSMMHILYDQVLELEDFKIGICHGHQVGSLHAPVGADTCNTTHIVPAACPAACRHVPSPMPSGYNAAMRLQNAL